MTRDSVQRVQVSAGLILEEDHTPTRRPSVGQVLELVDAVAAAVDADRATEVDRVRAALEPLGLDEAFTFELRLSGVGSLTWGRCEFCSDVLAELDASEGVAA